MARQTSKLPSVLLQNTRGMSDYNNVCVWLYNCVFYMYVCLGVVFLIIIFH